MNIPWWQELWWWFLDRLDDAADFILGPVLLAFIIICLSFFFLYHIVGIIHYTSR